MPLSRRDLLRALAASTAAALLPRAARAQADAGTRAVHLNPVRVDRARILKTVVGLRPFRPAGFVVRADKLDDKLLVHHYGHGGAGVTLSWGTAALAVDEVAKAPRAPVAVLGCGAVGLATARLLQARGLAVTIYAREQPPHTTSDVAGARWYPFDVFDKNVVSPAHLALLWRVSREAYAVFKKLGAPYGVRYYPTYACRNTPFPKESLLNFDSPMHELLPGLRDLAPDEKPVPYPIVRTFQTMMIEPTVYLPRVLADFAGAGGRIVVRDFKRVADVAALPERIVVNCTGLGAGALFGDTDLYPIKGQLTILKPQPEVDYVTLPPDLYMFPRSDGIVLGGTFERRIWTTEPNPVAMDKVLAGHARFFAALR